MDIKQLFEQAKAHQQEHGCSAHPYENGEKLVAVVNKYHSKRILEIGTGCGYTAAIMALASPGIYIDTLEKDFEHAQYATDFIGQVGVKDRVKIIVAQAEEFLPNLTEPYDLIFFDGYQIHYEFLTQYERLVKDGGILFLANNHLKSKTSDRFFDELLGSPKWKILDRYADTTILLKVQSLS